MKIILPQVDYVFDCGQDRCCSIVLEKQELFYRVLEDIAHQIQGEEGATVLSEEDKLLSFAKNGELLSQFVPFDMNKKALLTKITAKLNQLAVTEQFYERTQKLLAGWEKYLMELSMELVGNFDFSKISADSLLKAAGLHIDDMYDNLGEELLDYFELVQEYEGRKLFILVNLRSYMSDDEMEEFLENVLARGIQLLMLEGVEREHLRSEKRYIIDENLCLIC
jgi:CRISPR type II-A-associated protein Csn2